MRKKTIPADPLLPGENDFSRKERSAIANAVALGRKFLFDEPHGLQVARLSVSLFDQTKGLHGLGKEGRLLLFAAGVLHDIGMFISCSRHHKHSMYLIAQSNGIPDFSARQVRIIAQVARYHRKSGPSPTHGSFDALDKDDKTLVKKLSAYLRIGDALDREHRQSVLSVKASINRGTLMLRPKGSSPDHRSLKDKADCFEKVFKLKVSLFGEEAAE